MPNSTAQKIIELAEAAICTRGYSAFSFRELAAELGIKSASVHYHFPTKADLGEAAARQYLMRYQTALEHIAESHSDPRERLQALIALYRTEMLETERVTLCTALLAEKVQLPDSLRTLLGDFFTLNLQWLEHQVGLSQVIAVQAFSLLQGAFNGGKSLESAAYFDHAVAVIERLSFGSS